MGVWCLCSDLFGFLLAGWFVCVICLGFWDLVCLLIWFANLVLVVLGVVVLPAYVCCGVWVGLLLVASFLLT